MEQITEAFVDDVLRTGALTQAQARIKNGTAAPLTEGYAEFGTWSLVCEEVLDTEEDPERYDRVVAELLRRGISLDEINQMRRFAWLTAGWLNYDRMLWEWCLLDERHIRKALELQLRDGLISVDQFAESMTYVDRYTGSVDSNNAGRTQDQT